MMGPRLHLLPGPSPLVFAVDGSRLFGVTPDLFQELEKEEQQPQPPPETRLERDPEREPERELEAPSAISLNVAQSCNLACSYCYADEGRFGDRPGLMSFEVARTAIDRALEQSTGRRITIGFIGGEPFVNRSLLYRAVDHARLRAREVGASVGFSVTTNGTLLTPSDLEFLRRHAFAVSVSLDGSASANDAHRRSLDGTSAFDRTVRAVEPLLRDPGRTRIAARATLTRRDYRVLDRVRALSDLGFREVGVSPLRVSPNPDLAFRDEDWLPFLDEMVEAAESDWETARVSGRFHFSNVFAALKQIHVGHCKPLPCGSAASYVSVSARGEYFSCHRTINDSRFQMGNVVDGLDTSARKSFLRLRHVDLQEPCASCWARYFCGGGCHAEVIAAGRRGCDYIRGWLEFCLGAYVELSAARPDYFDKPRCEPEAIEIEPA
ncbi:MAG TPA: radical SAM protein, partial [Vicinamibacterales bacterium]|nr:radical SAM protein [Vicinamibacterales bacterium]